MDEPLQGEAVRGGKLAAISDAELGEVGRGLSQASVQLALAETGTAGEIARLLCATDEGAAAVTKAQVFDSPAELATALRVSPAKVAAFGAVSAMVAAEAAAELIDTYEGGWGLAVLSTVGNLREEAGVQDEGGLIAEGFIALGTPSRTIIQSCAAGNAVQIALRLLRQEAQHRTKRF